MMNLNIKMIVCDLDGTLFCDDKTVSQRTKDVVRKCRELGIKIVYATGRGSGSVNEVPFELFDGYVINNGASAYAGEEKIFSRLMSPEQVRPLLLACDARGLKTAAQFDGMHYSNFDISKEWSEFKINFEIIEFYLYELDSEKVYAVTSENEDVAAIRESLHVDSYLTMTRDGFVMIMHKEATKSNAAKALAEHWGIDRSEVVAFGDDLNDLDLLSYAGIGVAMENALPEAKSAADQVCGSNNDDGIARWLEENVL
jgi:Cof subfamily protein (haloacid dehalogenase superfamily)